MDDVAASQSEFVKIGWYHDHPCADIYRPSGPVTFRVSGLNTIVLQEVSGCTTAMGAFHLDCLTALTQQHLGDFLSLVQPTISDALDLLYRLSQQSIFFP